MENWKKITGFDYDYEVSDDGNVRCLNPFHKKSSGINYKQSMDVYGYMRVSLVINKKSKTIKTHRLVCEYFLPEFKPELTVNHIDFNKTNNHLSNLEMMTLSENTLDHKKKIVKKNSSSKVLGVGFHKGVNKWTARIVVNKKRFSIGTFNTEQEAIYAIQNSEESEIKIGKGYGNLGKRKFSKELDILALELVKTKGIKIASETTGISRTRINDLRKGIRI